MRKSVSPIRGRAHGQYGSVPVRPADIYSAPRNKFTSKTSAALHPCAFDDMKGLTRHALLRHGVSLPVLLVSFVLVMVGCASSGERRGAPFHNPKTILSRPDTQEGNVLWLQPLRLRPKPEATDEDYRYWTLVTTENGLTLWIKVEALFEEGVYPMDGLVDYTPGIIVPSATNLYRMPSTLIC